MNINQLAQMNIGDKMMKLSASKNITGAKDDAAGLAISEKLEAQINGLDTGNDNTAYMSDALNIADGGLSQINDSLTEIKTLSIQANNSFLSDDDKAIIQNQVNQLTEGINDVVKATSYNGQSLLDGSFSNKNTASYADGTGKSVSISDMTSVGLGLDGYDVTKGDTSAIDKAMSAVNAQRAELGANVNTNNYVMDSNSQTSLNLAAAKSRIVDLNVPKAVTEKNKENLLQSYQIMMQKNEQDNASAKVASLGLMG